VDPAELNKITSLQDRVARLTHRTLLSLLQLYDEDALFFYPNKEQEQERSKNPEEPAAAPNARDTATALLAIEHAQDIMRRDDVSNRNPDNDPLLKDDAKRKLLLERPRERFQEHRADLDDSLKEFQDGKVVALSYEPYRSGVFTRSLVRIANAKPSPPTGPKQTPPSPPPGLEEPKPLTIDEVLQSRAVPGETRAWSPFNCARVLALLHKYPAEDTHRELYMEALDGVLLAITQSYPPHYVFGGASLTGSESHAYLAHDCLMALAGLADVLEQRAKEHKNLSELLGKTDRWFTDDDDPFFKAYSDAASFSDFLADQLAGFRNPVGLSTPMLVLEKFAPSEFDRAPLVAEGLASQLTEALRGGVTLWLNQFKELVSRKITQVEREAKRQRKLLSPPKLVDKAGNQPGGAAMAATRGHLLLAGTLWRKAFFEGMLYVLARTAELYTPGKMEEKEDAKELTALGKVARAIKGAGNAWADSARLTREYLAKLAKWAQAEINRQITLDSLSQKTNFDPAQLAFAVGIYHQLASSPSKPLIDHALVLFFKAQHPDGTWPPGAPFVFKRLSTSANYASNLEVMNAVAPLIDSDRVARFRPHADRLFTWLEANSREIPSLLHVKGKTKTHTVTGWSSDRLYEVRRIDIWMNAAALHFLVFYKKLIQEDVNSHIQLTYDFKRPRQEWIKITDSELLQPCKDRVTTKVHEQFIVPFKRSGENPRSAMVLYGPPGTSKSTVAEAIATELGWTMVTITPSDFVKEGIEKSEAAARSLFKELNVLREVVVLFDEIDEILRDRQDQKSQSGIAMLRFLIPGMLPKLQALKQYGEKKRLIFIVATNYQDRLDAAITRTGRIDESFLLAPPDARSRYCLIRGFLEKRIRDEELFQDFDKDKRLPAATAFAKVLTELTAGWVYKELDLLVETITSRTAGKKEEWTKALHTLSQTNLREPSLETLLELKIEPIKLEETVSVPDKQELVTHKILGRRPSLDLLSFYADRPKAHEEVERVLRSYLLKDEILNDELAAQRAARGEKLATAITKPDRGNRSEEILAALSDALGSRSGVGSSKDNPKSPGGS
jgi:adenylate kinase family enzyme